MGLSLRGSTSGAIDINAPAVAGDNAITLPTSNGSANQFFKNSGTAGIVTYSSMVETTTGVGIGTVSPDFKIHSNETGGSTIAGLFETNQTDSYISFQASGTTASSTVRIGAVADNFVAFVNSAERLRIDSSGRVLVGTTTEGQAAADELTIYNNGHAGITIRSGTSSGGSIYFSDATSGGGEYSGYISYNHVDNSLKFGTNEVEKLRVLSGGGLTFNGDTATANALDDYEEGTITTWRLVKGDANTNGSNHAQTEVQYTKIGRCVYISGHIRTDGTEVGKTGNLKLVSTSDGSTAATLPFVPNHRGGLPIVHTRSCSTSDTTYGLSVGFNENSSTVYVYANDGTGDYVIDSNTLDTNTQTNIVITFNGHYFTDS